MQTISIQNYCNRHANGDKLTAYIWTEVGDGQFETVHTAHSNGDVWAHWRQVNPDTFGAHWYCSGPQDNLYLFDSHHELEHEESRRRRVLASRRGLTG